MAGQHNIWNRLQEYEVFPPRELFDRLQGLIHSEEATGGESGSMGRLGQYEVQPPAFLRSSIEKLIAQGALEPAGNGVREITPTGKRKIASADLRKTSFRGLRKVALTEGRRIFPWKGYGPYSILKTVAACLLLVTASWLVYRAVTPAKQIIAKTSGKKSGTRIDNTAASQKSASLTGTDSLSKTAGLNPAEGNTAAAVSTIKDSSSRARIGKYRTRTDFHIEGQTVNLVDNDFLATFASFKYNEIPAFLNPDKKEHEKKSWKIHVDQYASIIISKPMSAFMKDMNSFKTNGNLTRKARKSREKLDKWKKADERQFDHFLKNNPLDPIDLADFIYK